MFAYLQRKKYIINRKSWKRADLKLKKELLWSLVPVYSDYPRSPHTVTTHGLVAFQVSKVWFRLQLFRTGTAFVFMSAGAAVVASAAAHLVPTATAPFPSMYSALSSSASCCRTFLRALLLLVLLEWDAGIDPSQGKDVKESFHLWQSTPSPSGPGRPRFTCYCCCTSQTLVFPSPH